MSYIGGIKKCVIVNPLQGSIISCPYKKTSQQFQLFVGRQQ